jgi:peptide-methionine (S)-S-oxide reductase
MTDLRRTLIVVLLAAATLSGCGRGASEARDAVEHAAAIEARTDLQTAIFAAGCFWCVEQAFDAVPGVLLTTSGYIGGQVANPSYRQVSAGRTGHTEALRVRFDPSRVSYAQLLQVYWRNVDPTDAGGQFCDRGSQYRSGIFYLDDTQRGLADASRQALLDDPQAPKPIVTEITQASTFYPAEDYHQDYHQKNPLRYSYYKSACGRADRLEALWGKE